MEALACISDFALLLAQGATQAQAPVTRVEVTPARAEIPIGQTLRLSATARDSSGRALPNVPIRWMGHGEGSVDSTGLLKGGYAGYVHVFAMAAADSTKPVLGEAVIRVLPLPASRIQIQPAPVEAPGRDPPDPDRNSVQRTGRPSQRPGQLQLERTAGGERHADGRLTALAPGQATITARSGAAGRRSRCRSFPIRRRGWRWSRAEDGQDRGRSPLQGRRPRMPRANPSRIFRCAGR